MMKRCIGMGCLGLLVLLAGCFDVDLTPPDIQTGQSSSDTARSQGREGRGPDRVAPARPSSPSGGSSGGASAAGAVGGGGSVQSQAVDAVSAVLGGGRRGVLFFGEDILATPGASIQPAARVRNWDGRQRMDGIVVAFYDDDSREIARAITNKDGWATCKPMAAAGRPGLTIFTARVLKVPEIMPREILDLPPATVVVSVQTPATRFVVVDLDGTLCTGGKSGFLRVAFLDGGKMRVGSQRAMVAIAKRYRVIYLTHRPVDLTRRSRKWLRSNGYPAGPILLSRFSEAVGDSEKYKTRRLREIRRVFPNLLFGIGDKAGDIVAYRKAGMTAIWTPWYKAKWKDMQKAAREINAMRDAKVIVCANWRQVQSAVAGKYTCSPNRFARQLQTQAGRIRQAERDDEDDEDD